MNEKPNCKNHPKEVAGISDMVELSKRIGDLNYESLYRLFGHLAIKLSIDGKKDEEHGRGILSYRLFKAAKYIAKASDNIEKAYLISKP